MNLQHSVLEPNAVALLRLQTVGLRLAHVAAALPLPCLGEVFRNIPQSYYKFNYLSDQ